VTDWLLALVPTYGPWLLFAATFLSCMALPIPASVLMLAAGGFVAAGDLSLATTATAAWAGAVAGDQAGYWAGRVGGAGLLARAGKGGLLARATAMLAEKGGLAVYLTRWLFSALGPYVNLAGGAARMPLARFTIWSVLGEGTWVALYVGLGRTFAGNLEAASAQAVSILGFLAAGAVAIGLGYWLFRAMRGTQAQG
jgi:membrane-associated protein